LYLNINPKLVFPKKRLALLKIIAPMDLETLGYTYKWIEFKILNKDILNDQIEEYKSGEDDNLEHYRYYTLMNWLENKKKLSQKEINQFLTVAKEDPEQQMAGAAVKTLFTSPILTEEQYESLKLSLPEFGEWTEKVIKRQDLLKRLKDEKLTFDLYLSLIHISEPTRP